MWNLWKKTKATNIPDDHKHSWALVAKTYARPRKDVNMEQLSPEMAEKLLFGVTSLVWECTECGLTRQEYLLGSDMNTLDEVLDKVGEFGSQMVEREGVRYLVTRWVQQQQSTGVLPLR